MLQAKGSDSPADRASNELIPAHVMCHDSTSGSVLSVFPMTAKPILVTVSIMCSTTSLGVAIKADNNVHMKTYTHNH
jgi:hypothetical protein